MRANHRITYLQQLDSSSRTNPRQPGSCPVHVSKQQVAPAATAKLAPAAQPRPAAAPGFPDTRGSLGAGRYSHSLFRRCGRSYSGAGGGTTTPRLPCGWAHPGVPRYRPAWWRGAVLLLLLLLPAPAEAARPGLALSLCSWRLRSRGGGQEPVAMEHWPGRYRQGARAGRDTRSGWLSPGGRGSVGWAGGACGLPRVPWPVSSARGRLPGSREAPRKGGWGGRQHRVRLAPLRGNSGGCSRPGPAGPALRVPRKISVFFSANTRCICGAVLFAGAGYSVAVHPLWFW